MIIWQSMESAPRDGREIVVRIKTNDVVRQMVVHWGERAGPNVAAFGPQWFYWDGYEIASLPTLPIEWRK